MRCASATLIGALQNVNSYRIGRFDTTSGSLSASFIGATSATACIVQCTGAVTVASAALAAVAASTRLLLISRYGMVALRCLCCCCCCCCTSSFLRLIDSCLVAAGVPDEHARLHLLMARSIRYSSSMCADAICLR